MNMDNSLLGQLCHWTKIPWTTVSLDYRPLDNCCNTLRLEFDNRPELEPNDPDKFLFILLIFNSK